MKKKIKLTESDLHNIIKESVNHILSELDWRTYQNASDKAYKLSDETTDPYEKQRRIAQAKNFVSMGKKKYSTQYNLPKDFDQKMALDQINPTQGQLKNAAKRNKETKDFYSHKSEYKNGKWQNKN